MTLLFVVLSVLLQAATPPQTPQDCVKAGRDFSTKRLKELGPTTGDTVRQVTSKRLAMLRECAAQFDIAKTEEGHASRRQRKKIEMLFAHLKRVLKLDRLRLRGPSGAQDEFLLAATAQNLRRMAKLLTLDPLKQQIKMA